MKEYFAGFDIGATKLALVIADRDGNIAHRLREKIDIASGHFADYKDSLAYLGVGNQMKCLLRRAMKEAGIDNVAALGIGSAGPLKDGDIRDSTNIRPIHRPEPTLAQPLYIPLVQPLEEEFGIPVRVANDCVAAVLGEVYYGVGKDAKDKSDLYLVYVTLSTGLGGGVWDGGHLLIGKQGNAAEVGHFFAKKDGLKCGCGNLGCVESYCSGTGIANNAKEHLRSQPANLKEGPGSVLRKLAWEQARKDARFEGEDPSDSSGLERVTAALVFAAAEAGDRLAQSVIGEACYYGGIAFANIANAYDPQIITVGGTLVLEHPEILEPMQREMLKHINVEAPEVLLTPLGDEVVEYGTIVLAQQAAGLQS